MKNTLKILLSLALLPLVATASVSISGAALRNVNSLSGGDYSVLLANNTGADLFSISILADSDLSSSATYAGFEVLQATTAASSFGSTTASFNTVFDLGTVSTGDSFAVLTFDGSSSTAVGGSSFDIWDSGSWTVGADGSANTFGGAYTQFTSGSAGSTGIVTVVPEPSTYATLAGLLALGFVMLRRRG